MDSTTFRNLRIAKQEHLGEQYEVIRRIIKKVLDQALIDYHQNLVTMNREKHNNTIEIYIKLMEFDFIPFSHDYYIMNLPDPSKQISEENRETLFNVLEYRNCLDYNKNPIK